MDEKIKGPGGIWLQIDLDDEATPVLVCAHLNGILITSTWDCANDTACIDDRLDLNTKQMVWLESLRDKTEKAYQIARRDSPNYPD
jgi:hypothetical protein